jgi:serine/threonine protein kinase
MAPEQTGRMNRSIDARSDLYSLGVMFQESIDSNDKQAIHRLRI